MNYIRNTVGALLASATLMGTAIGGELERKLGFPLLEENAITQDEIALVQEANKKFYRLEQEEKLLQFYEKCVKEAELNDTKYQIGLERGEKRVEDLRREVHDYSLFVPESTKQLTKK